MRAIGPPQQFERGNLNMPAPKKNRTRPSGHGRHGLASVDLPKAQNAIPDRGPRLWQGPTCARREKRVGQLAQGKRVQGRASRSTRAAAAGRSRGWHCPPLDVYRAHGHRRLDPHTCVTKCGQCPWGLTMVTEIIIDQWNPSKKRWRLETHCYGPRDCPRYRAGSPRKVPGRKPWMVWVDDDVERASN